MEIRRLEGRGPVGWPNAVIAVGNFDGVHLGHRSLAAAVVERARASGGTPAALTFDPHPARVLHPERAPAALSTFEQKVRWLAAAGIERLAVLPFDRAVADLVAEAFVESVLCSALAARLVVVGESFRFGRGRAGDVPHLRVLGARLGFEVASLPPVERLGGPVSSTRIREALGRGAVEEACELLGRPYSIEGRVVAGDRRGQELGFPTANLEPFNELLPRDGVYAAVCGWEDQPPARMGVVNVGRRPTFGGGEVRAEVHLPSFSGDLYGRTLRVDLVARLRDERRFAGREALVAQIRADVDAARRVLEKAS